MKIKCLSAVVACIALSGCGETSYIVADIPGDAVEIYLQDDLGGILSGFCIDIAKGREDVDPANGLQAHTCYSYTGKLGSDQSFSPSSFSQNRIYMPAYELCVAAVSLTSGSKIGLAACDGSEGQQFSFSGEGRISSIAAPSLCMTAAEETTAGGGSQHQIKVLTLEECSDDLDQFQLWATRTADA